MTREDMLLTDVLVRQKNDFAGKRHMVLFYTFSALLGRMEGFCKSDLDIVSASAILENVDSSEPPGVRRATFETLLTKAGYPETFFDVIISLAIGDDSRGSDMRKRILDESRTITGCLESDDPGRNAVEAMNGLRSNNGFRFLFNLCIQPGF